MSILCSVIPITKDGRFLVFKGNTTAVIPNLWSAGVIESKDDEIIDDTIRNFYISGFNADIDIFKNNAYYRRPIPISTVAIESNRVINGKNVIINLFYFMGILRNPDHLALGTVDYSDYIIDTYDNIIDKIKKSGIPEIPELFYNMQIAKSIAVDSDTEYKINIENSKNPTDEMDMTEFDKKEKDNNGIEGIVENETLVIEK